MKRPPLHGENTPKDMETTQNFSWHSMRHTPETMDMSLLFHQHLHPTPYYAVYPVHCSFPLGVIFYLTKQQPLPIFCVPQATNRQNMSFFLMPHISSSLFQDSPRHFQSPSNLWQFFCSNPQVFLAKYFKIYQRFFLYRQYFKIYFLSFNKKETIDYEKSRYFCTAF